MHHLGDLLDQLRLVDHIGNLGHDDAVAVAGHLLDLALGAHDDPAAALVIGVVDAAPAENDAAGREIRPLDVLHQVVHGAVRVVQHADHAVDDLAQIVRRNVGRHADRNARRTVDQQVRKARRHDRRLHERLIEVRVEVDGLLFDVAHHLHRQLGQPRLGIAHCGRAVAVHGAKVSLPIDEQVARGEILRKANHRIVDGAVAVRVVFAEHVADDARRFAERLVRRDAQLVHGVENPAMHGFQSVAHIRKRAADDDRHRIGDKRFF